MEKWMRIVRSTIYVLVGIWILVFNEALLDYLAYLVGGVMLLYAVEGICVRIIESQVRKHLLDFIQEIILLLLAVLMILVRGNIEKICVIWAIWSILREGEEIAVVLKTYNRKSVLVISLIESLIVIILSSLLVIDPVEHAQVHIVILGIEMLLEVLFPFLDGYEKLEGVYADAGSDAAAPEETESPEEP